MTFSTIKLTGERVVVRGTDINGTTGEEVLDASQWNELGARKQVEQAQVEFDKAVEEFFAPLERAAERASQVAERPRDMTGYLVIEEPVEHQHGKPGRIVKLTRDSIILRLIEQGNTDRLLWVGEHLEVTEETATPQAQQVFAGNGENTGDAGSVEPSGDSSDDVQTHDVGGEG